LKATGAEALGETLRVNKTLKVLDLGWNFIRLNSAVALALSLEVNHTLSTLLLGYNSFGDMPSQVLKHYYIGFWFVFTLHLAGRFWGRY